ncbi:SIR2 family protein [Pseudarthrobacter sp. YS3]|uniref:SIR2 family protein n=1 Tax=Pseudarthrobacter sp. YS3 TaxID=3453718 RepID=UPI003F6E47BA
MQSDAHRLPNDPLERDEIIRDAVRKMNTARLYDYFEQDYVGVLVHLDAAMRMLASRGSYNQISSYFSQIDADFRSKLGPAEGVADLSIVSNLLRQGRLVLVCGAGVSCAAGLPGWQELVRRCLAMGMDHFPDRRTELSEVHERLGGPGPCRTEDLMAASETLEDASGPAFAQLIREVIYGHNGLGRGAWQTKAPTDLHRAIVQMGYSPVGSGTPGLAAILTYNFDDLLEAAFRYYFLGVTVWASFRGQIHPTRVSRDTRDVTPIWHAHGWIPRLPIAPDPPVPGIGDVAQLADLVFSEQSYKQKYNESNSLTREVHDLYWNNTALSCLFLGSSFTDGYQLKQLREFRKALWFHYAFVSPPTEMKTDQQRQVWYQEEKSRLALVGVRPIPMTHAEYPGTLKLLTDLAGVPPVRTEVDEEQRT